MNESTSNHLNNCNLDDSSETHQFNETSCVVDEKFVPKVGMIFKTLEEAAKFYKHYSKLAGFSTKIRNMTRDGDKIKNQLIVCSREGRWKSKISPTLKTNPSAGLNCRARIYHNWDHLALGLMDVGALSWRVVMGWRDYYVVEKEVH
ncbi:hypothetical protein Ahy_B04g073506 [Arachis hypogaea]|uniref:FAR1 domain-containing protein n=1 Tax=Arachis hypogaea TaxID=3818 RepID=A0A444ZQP1_ARAHY|nr:hypothetical protein Ahy_B04g073506 [Arachis hypogaea]